MLTRDYCNSIVAADVIRSLADHYLANTATGFVFQLCHCQCDQQWMWMFVYMGDLAELIFKPAGSNLSLG